MSTQSTDPARDPAAIKEAQAQLAELRRTLAATAGERAQRQQQKPLYERLGGRAAFEAVLSDVVDLHFAEDLTRPLFQGVDRQKLIRLATDYFCNRTGGAEKYTGRDMVSAHAHLNLTDVHFMVAGDQVMRVLAKHQVPKPEQEEILALLVSHHDELVR